MENLSQQREMGVRVKSHFFLNEQQSFLVQHLHCMTISIVQDKGHSKIAFD